MPSQFFGLNIGAGALSAFQTSINVTANNISNVQTVGYTRQSATLESTDAIRFYTKYGSIGTGVAATEIRQERDLFYDAKYWENSGSKGFYEQKLYYLDQIESVFTDNDTQEGFSTIFAKMFNALDTVKNNAADESVRNQFIHQAQSLCTYFNALHTSLQEIQEDANEEIKNSVDCINTYSSKIALLNKQINTVEISGGFANELRDERAKLIDELSAIVDVETTEYEVQNTYGENLGGTNYTVMINGQVLVDGNDYRALKCTSSSYKKSMGDIEGLYEIKWADTGMRFAATTGTANGSLKALFDIRDGNYNQNLTGEITAISENSFTISPPSITNINALNLPDEGQVIVNNTVYTYDGWSAEVGENGELTSFTFNLKEPLSQNEVTKLVGRELSQSDSIGAMGIPYYQQQLNEFLREFTKLFNEIEQKGETLNGEQMGSFFVGTTKTGVVYDFDEWQKDENGEYPSTISSETDSYYQLTAETIVINEKSLRDPGYFSTAATVKDGADAYDIVEELLTLQEDVTMFRGDDASSFLEKLISDISVDTEKVETYSKNYTNLDTVISNMRTSVSGVDEDEEALSLIKFQNAYNLASKVISVMSELYDKLINETGV